MTRRRGFALFLTVAVAGALLHADNFSLMAPPSSARLTAISSHVHANGTSLIIEASEPVPYVARRPDSLTLLVDFRNVASDGVANSVAASKLSPIAAVAVEPAESSGSPAARVRITLSQPVAHRVRSDRNTIVIDFDKLDATATPSVPPPAIDPIAALGLDKKAEPPAGKVPQAQEMLPAPAPAPTQSTVRQQLPPPGEPVAPGQRKFTGHPISMDFQGVDLRSVLRVFAEESGLNIVVDPAVQGTVDVQLRDVPWDQALDIILRANKLGYIIDGTIVRIAPLTVLAEEETQRRKLSDEQALAGQLQVLTKSVSYAKAEELQVLLTKSALSQRGTVQVDARTNTLIITDLPERLQTANDLIAILDKPQPQVEIEARIVQTNKNYARALGVQWGFNGRVDPALGNTTNLAFPNNGNLGGRTGGTVGPTGGTATTQQPTAVNLAVPAATSAVGLALGSVNGAFNLDMALSALEASGNGRLLSTPKVTTLNNVAAEMKQGVQIPIQTVANNTVTVQFKDAALILRVTPQITSANTVIMQVTVENASPDFSRAVNNIPPINTQSANTTVLVNDGMTTVIGGIYVSQEQSATDRTPGVSHIPLLGWLFRRDTLNDQSTELLVFITPHIMKD